MSDIDGIYLLLLIIASQNFVLNLQIQRLKKGNNNE